MMKNCLEAFAVNNRWTRFIIFLLGDPHGLKGGQRSQNGATDPYRVFALWWSNDFDFHGAWRQCGDFFLHTISNARVHGGAARQDSVCVQVFSNIDVALHDRVISGLMDACSLHSQERGLEQGFGASESLIANGDHLSVRQLIGLLQ